MDELQKRKIARRGSEACKTPLLGSEDWYRQERENNRRPLTPRLQAKLARQEAERQKRALRKAETLAKMAALEAEWAEKEAISRAIAEDHRKELERIKKSEDLAARELRRRQESALKEREAAIRRGMHVAKQKRSWLPAAINYETGKIVPGRWYWELHLGE